MEVKARHQSLPDSTPSLEVFQVELQQIEKSLTDTDMPLEHENQDM